MRQFTIELDETVCKWLEHTSALTNKPIESLIAAGIGNLVIAIEGEVFDIFTESKE